MTNQPSASKGFALKLLPEEKLKPSQRLQLIEKDIPQLEEGEVLIKVLAAPVNPSDLVYLMGKYGVAPIDGHFAGFEGCGIVINANAGLYGKWLTGKRVAFFATPGKDGSWAQYVITKPAYCIPVRKELTDEQAATLVVNPCTSVCLVERAMELKAKAIVLNAAASQVGKGVIRYAKQVGLKTIATVRSEDNRQKLLQLGANAVLNINDYNFSDSLKSLANDMRATVFLDAVADEETALIGKLLPAGSTAIVYGRLTETHDPIGGKYGVADVIFRDIKIEGFWLSTYVRKAGPIKTLLLTRKVQKLFAEGIFDTDLYGSFGFSEFLTAIDHYAEHKSDGKVILSPNQQ